MRQRLSNPRDATNFYSRGLSEASGHVLSLTSLSIPLACFAFSHLSMADVLPFDQEDYALRDVLCMIRNPLQGLARRNQVRHGFDVRRMVAPVFDKGSKILLV